MLMCFCTSSKQVLKPAQRKGGKEPGHQAATLKCHRSKTLAWSCIISLLRVHRYHKAVALHITPLLYRPQNLPDKAVNQLINDGKLMWHKKTFCQVNKMNQLHVGSDYCQTLWGRMEGECTWRRNVRGCILLLWTGVSYSITSAQTTLHNLILRSQTVSLCPGEDINLPSVSAFRVFQLCTALF